MNAKNNRQNHNFQIAYFLAGACHTPDGAYALLCDLKADRELALATAVASDLRTQAKRIRAEHVVRMTTNEADRYEAQADLEEIEAFKKLGEDSLEAARSELRFIEKCIDKVQPLRKFAHLSAQDAHEAAQYDEWKLELINRAENALLSVGHIPTDQFSTMRLHPAFSTEILPAIINIQGRMKFDGGTGLLTEGKASFGPVFLEAVKSDC